MNHQLDCFSIGLTGGIASGKSAVSNIFASLGCEIIDTDIIARKVVKPGSNGLNQVISFFGDSIITDDKQLDRAKLREIVFNDSKKLSILNSILHPLIQQQVIVQIKSIEQKYCIIVIPLLCEISNHNSNRNSNYGWLDRKLIVDVKTETQVERLVKRDSISEILANKMLSSQCSREQRLSIADDVINNEQSLDDLQKRVETLYCLYKNF